MRVSFSIRTLVASLVLLSPLASRADTLQVDFGLWSPPLPADWNNARSITRTGTVNLKNTSGAATGYSLKMVNGFLESHSLGNKTAGGVMGLPTGVVSDSIYVSTVKGNSGGQKTYWNPTVLMEMRGLNPAYIYNFNFYAFVNQNDSWNRSAQYTAVGANTVSASLNPTNNASNAAVVNGVRPNASGLIQIKITKASANNTAYGYYHLSSFRMVYAPAAGPLPSPTPSPTPTSTPTGTPVTASYGLRADLGGLALSATLNQSGKVHYAVYSGDNVAAKTSAQVKAAASAALGGGLVARGTLTAASSASTTISGLADKARYTVFAVSENSVGSLAPDASVKRYIGVVPRKISQQSYNTAIAGKSSVLVRYMLTVPADYYNNPDARYPVVMYIHGGGETFTDSANSESFFTTNATTRMDHTPLAARIKLGKEMPFVTVSPQCNSYYFNCANGEETRFYAEVIDRVNATYRTNAKRYYVAGMSWGGSGTWKLGYDYPQKVTAIAPISGAFYRTLSGICSRFGTNKVPVWASANVADPYFPYTSSRDAINTLKGCSGAPDARFTLFNGQTYPATIHPHNTVEYVMNAPYKNYQASPPSLTNYNISLAPEFVSGLATAENELRSRLGQPALELDELYDWFMLWSKP